MRETAAATTLLLATALVGCGPEPWGEPAAGRQAIVGGADEARFETTGALVVDHGGGAGSIFCSAVAVTPTVVVSAAHCLDGFDDAGSDPVVFLLRGSSGGIAYRTLPETRQRHPRWPDSAYDVGVFALLTPLPALQYPRVRRSPVGAAEVGTELVTVGYGETSPGAGDAGVKRSVPMQVHSAEGPYFVVRHPEGWRGVCNGDSGGPSFLVGPSRDALWGIHARTQDVEHCGPGEDTSAGDLFGSFLEGALAALDPDATTCGDGVCTGLEVASECSEDCLGGECGDGVLEPPEVCDDGNTTAGDGCSADCASDETCGNGVVDEALGEACDDGNSADGDGCSADCAFVEECGDCGVERDGGPPGTTGDCGCRAAGPPSPRAWPIPLALLWP